MDIINKIKKLTQKQLENEVFDWEEGEDTYASGKIFIHTETITENYGI